MLPELLGCSTVALLWTLGGVVGFTSGIRVTQKRGLSTARAVGVLTAFTLLCVGGAKLHAMLAHPHWGVMPIAELLRHGGFHVAGGIVLGALGAPIVFRTFRVPAGPFLDAIAPTIAVTLVIVRIGCLLGGCCFGVPCDLPWGLAYPPGGLAFSSAAAAGHLSADGLATVPLHPIALYFVLAALAMVPALRWLETRARYGGELAVWLLVLWGWSTVAIESFRDVSAVPRGSNLSGAALVIAVAATALLLVSRSLATVRHHPPAPSGARVVSHRS